jgi:predicted porin
LGNGLRAVYLFEWGIMADEGASPGQHPLYGARNTWAGLAGSFGTVTLGRHEAPTMTYMGMSSPFFINGLKPTGQFRSKMTGLMGELRWSNSISYNSPNFSGVEFTGIYSFGEKVNGTKNNAGGYNTITGNCTTGTVCESADTSDAGKLGLGVKYANGPLYLSAIYQQRADDDSMKAYGASANTGYGAKGWAIGGAYDFKVVKLYANYFRQKANHDGLAYNNPARGSDKQSIWSLGITVPVSSAGTVFAEYAQYKDDLKCNRASSCNPPAGNLANMGDKSKGYMIGYRHNLSRRTFLTAFVTRFDNDRGIDGGWSKTMLAAALNAADPGRSTGLVGEKQTIFVTGLVHNF